MYNHNRREDMKRFFSVVGQFAAWFLFWFFVKYRYLVALSVLFLVIGAFFKPCLLIGVILACVTGILALVRTFLKLVELGIFTATMAGAGAVASKMNSYNDKVNKDDPNRMRSI